MSEIKPATRKELNNMRHSDMLRLLFPLSEGSTSVFSYWALHQYLAEYDLDGKPDVFGSGITQFILEKDPSLFRLLFGYILRGLIFQKETGEETTLQLIEKIRQLEDKERRLQSVVIKLYTSIHSLKAENERLNESISKGLENEAIKN
jgi:hypothetical protein